MATNRLTWFFSRSIMWWLGWLLAMPVVVAEQLPIKTYTTADGLPSNFVHRIVRDSRGFLWFCTSDGLGRFDGYNFTNYGTEQGLPHQDIRDILETRHGVYWIATHGGGVCRFNPSVRGPWSLVPRQEQEAKDQGPRTKDQLLFTVYPVGDHPGANSVHVLHEDRAGRLWAGTEMGLYQLDETNGRGMFRRVELGVPGGVVRALVEDQEGSLWIGIEGGLARRLPNGRMIQYAVRPSPSLGDPVWALLIDREGGLWVGHQYAGLIVFNPEPAARLRTSDSGIQRSLRFTIGHPQSAIHNASVRLPVAPGEAHQYTTTGGLVRDIHQASDGRIWIAVSGVNLVEFDGQRFRSYTKAQGISENGVTALAEDRAGNLWMGTDSSGAMRLACNGFVTYTEADGLGHSRINSVFETQAGELYVVSGQIGINRFDGRRFTAVWPNLPQQVTYFGWGWHQITFQDHAGEWWVATGQGLCRFPRVGRVEQLAHTRPKAVYTTREGLSGNEVFRLFEDSRGNIWIGTISPGPSALTRWERATETFHRYAEADGIPVNAPTAFGEDRSGHLWIGFYDGGLARYRDGRFTVFTAAAGVPAGMIRGLYLDRAGRLWVGANGGGLGRLDDPTANRPRLTTYTMAQGLASNSVWGVTEDRWGRIYIATGRGVDRLDPATDRIMHYITADELAMSELRAAYRDRHGSLWFGTLQGLLRLIPEPDRPGSPPPILITGLRVEGDPISVSELGETEASGLELKPGQNQIQIDFVSLSFAAGQGLRYQYKLDGAKPDWSAPTDQRAVNYASLSPGVYRFLVRAISAEGLVSPTPATVAFTILPPIWQRWWFLMLGAMVAGAVGYAIHRNRMARLLELERVRTRIATDLHDDIGAGLSQMALFSEVVKQRIGVDPQKSEQMLTEIAETGRQLVEAMSDIVWAIDPRRDDLKNLGFRVRQLAADVLGAQGIQWALQTPEEPEKVKLSPEQRRHLYLIFKEAINNIVRHADCASVWLTFGVKDNQLVAEIRDDGGGFVVPNLTEASNQPRQGNGLVNMRARAAELGGQWRIESAPGRGTTVRLTVPLK